MKRLKRGELKAMTPEQRKARKRALQTEWRRKNPDKIKAQNHKWALHYQRTRPFKCVCHLCGREFGAPRNYFVTCQDCIKKRVLHSQYMKKAAVERAKAKKARNKEIIRLHKKGLLQREIAERVDIKQAAVSYVLRVNGYRTQKERTRK